MLNTFIIKCADGSKHTLKTDYKAINIRNRMAIYYYFESVVRMSRHDIVKIYKAESDEYLEGCRMGITVTKELVHRYNRFH